MYGGYNRTVEEPDDTCPDGCIMYKSMTYTGNMKWAGLYMMFSWFWTSQFVIAVGQLVVAMSVSMWYFTKDKSTVGNKTFFAAAKKAMYYHFGTAAFGSLIIAIIKTIRVVVAYLQVSRERSEPATSYTSYTSSTSYTGFEN
jgi:choline transporter-like protein 2/4/5